MMDSGLMENSERVLSGTGEAELDPNMVSEEAGKLYSELQVVVERHGEGVVEALVPTFVWVLEGLASSRAQLREREDELERERGERDQLLERYQAERSRRKESQERFLELEDQMEQERRTMRSREMERERRARELEKKAREQADQLVLLEEQKSVLGRELNSLKHSHYKLNIVHQELMERRKEAERESPHRNLVQLMNAETSSSVVSSEPRENGKGVQRSLSLSSHPCVEDRLVFDGQKSVAVPTPSNRGDDGFVNDIIGSTPELAQFQFHQTSTPGGPDQKEEKEEEVESSWEEQTEPCLEESREEEQQEEREEEEDEESVEWELRNTDSVFSELSELSRDYVESVDRGASVRGSADQMEEVLTQFEELKANNELLDAARKSLISRVVELTDDREALRQEVTSLQETNTHLEGRAREKEEENRRIRKELEAFGFEDPDASLPSSARSFSRSEMARVVMEKNQYKQRLLELQEAVRHSQTLRASKEEKLTEEKRSSVWRKFNRLFGLTKPPLGPPSAAALSSSPSLARSSFASSPLPSANQTPAERCSGGGVVSCRCAALSSRSRRRELYREIRSQLWSALGKRQLHGWSVPLGAAEENEEPMVTEPKDVPVLVRLRLLDHRDATAKLNCALAVPPEVSGDATCVVWVVSGPASCSDITVIDPSRSNAVLDQFSLPPTAPALCLCAVPPIGDSAGSVWIGTQEGSIRVHPSSGDRRLCLQTVHLAEGVHSLTYIQGRVVAGLSDGTLAFFSHGSGGWNLQSPSMVPLGSNPLQPVRCCLAKGQKLWVGYWNRVHVVHIDEQRVERSFVVSERSEQQVRFLCAGGSGVWTACRLDPVLRLFDWSSGRLLQEVNLTTLVTKTLGQPFLSLSPLQISALSIIAARLWVGTGGGAIFSLPLNITSEDVSIPYCSSSLAQLCYHGHRQTVRFIIAANGCLMTSPVSNLVQSAQLVLSGGEGYINFRIGDDAADSSSSSSDEPPPSSPQRSDRSHMIIWQNPSPPAVGQTPP